MDSQKNSPQIANSLQPQFAKGLNFGLSPCFLIIFCGLNLNISKDLFSDLFKLFFFKLLFLFHFYFRHVWDKILTGQDSKVSI